MSTKNCCLCATELKFLTTPSFGSGKLKDDKQVCLSCFQKIVKIDKTISLKKYTMEEVQQLMADGAADASQKDAKLEEIKATIQNLKLDNVSSFFGRKEIKELPNILAANETIDNIVQGTYNKGQGILVSTNRRLIFIDKGLLYGLKVEDFPLDKISSIQYETGILFGKIKIHTSGNISLIEDIEKSAARKFAEFVRDKLSQPKEQAAPVIIQQAAAQTSVLDQLAQLGQLKDSGILSADEFSEQKKKLLEKL